MALSTLIWATKSLENTQFDWVHHILVETRGELGKMTLNFNYPLQARLYYEYAGLEHVHTVGLRPGTGVMAAVPGMGTEFYQLGDFNGEDISFATWADFYVNGSPFSLPVAQGIKYFMGNTTTISRVELWRFLPGTNNGQFLGVQEMGVVGTFGGVGSLLGSMIWTFRTAEGGTARIQIMEGRMSDQTGRYAYSALDAAVKIFLQKMYLDAGACTIARDGSRMVSFIRQSNSQNESVFKKRHRQ